MIAKHKNAIIVRLNCFTDWFQIENNCSHSVCSEFFLFFVYYSSWLVSRIKRITAHVSELHMKVSPRVGIFNATRSAQHIHICLTVDSVALIANYILTKLCAQPHLSVGYFFIISLSEWVHRLFSLSDRILDWLHRFNKKKNEKDIL